MNVENEMWEQLKSEIKSELREELKAEIINEFRNELKQEIQNEFSDNYRDEVREIIKIEFRKIILKEKHFEKMLKAIIATLCYENIHFQQLNIAGKVHNGITVHEYPEHSSGKVYMKKRNNVEIEKLYNEYKSSGDINCTYEEFKKAVTFNNVISDARIEWRQKGTRSFSYLGLFELYNRIYDEDFSKLDDVRKFRFMLYLSKQFSFKGKTRTPDLIKKRFDAKYMSEK